ncbi:Encapsulating protein for peroxidase [Parafrankia irregularis]|uniref:Encapsulating protein for peroxidase n=1 Tax=Parafrankia irregularis TaxID=795642 RepID=A0A0S4QPV8_9ACTN|nr:MULTISPECIES: family 1 encapsulin nanocompartment shell protein [Parafrankia]MBE3200238.1 encapsulin [Parafrankia sp. CH37]CUU56566.1 Encapsulating protein for peroxidase [Parafrankia irregularis]
MNGSEWLQAHQGDIDQIIAGETEQARLAQRLLPAYPVPEQMRFVSSDRFDYEAGTVDDETRVDIERFEEKVSIPKLQIDDPNPARALVAVRHAAQKLARKHDERVFRKGIADEIVEADGIADEILKAGGKLQFHRLVDVKAVNGSLGEGLIPSVASALAVLDDEGYRTGYAIVASNSIWTELHRRGDGSSTIPIDAVKALIDDGPVYRSSVLENGGALLLSLAEGRIDRVVAEAPRLAFITQGKDMRRFDLYERFVPRLRETMSAVLLRAKPRDEA